MRQFRFWLFISIFWLSNSVFGASVNICGMKVEPNHGIDGVDYIYYQVDLFLDDYNYLLSKYYETDEDCWAEVYALLKETPFVKEYGFSKNGAPAAFREWYTYWYFETFMNNIPGAIPSKLVEPFRYKQQLHEI